MVGKRIFLLLAAVVMTAASGASCPQILQQYTQPIPRALPPSASLPQVIEVVNDNSAKIQSLYAPRGSISTPGLPSLRANIAFQRSKCFRLRAETSFFGPEVDLGSNDQLFWFWIRSNNPRELYFCRHEQFATSSIRQMFPIEPTWLIEALGVVSFDPNLQHQGPVSVGGGRLKITTVMQAAQGELTRVVVVDESRGIVLEEHVYDRQGTRLLASAVLSRHMRDLATGVTMPRHSDIQWSPTGAKIDLRIDLGDLQINTLDARAQELWNKPSGYTEVDVGNPNLSSPIAPQGLPPGAAPPSSAAYLIPPARANAAPIGNPSANAVRLIPPTASQY